MLEHYDAAVLKIHEAALEPARWGEALAAVSDVLGSAGAVMRATSSWPCRQASHLHPPNSSTTTPKPRPPTTQAPGLAIS